MKGKKTKIVCTLGPACSSEKVLRSMVRAGMDVARLNFSHGSHREHERMFRLVRKIAAEEGRPVAVMADMQGPKIRLGSFREETVKLNDGDRFILTSRKISGTKQGAHCTYRALPRDVKPGDNIFLNDGMVKLEVERVTGGDVFTRVLEGGEISDHKGINLPGITLSTAGITRKDVSDLKFSIALGADMVALSFVRSVADIRKARRVIKRAGSDVPIIAKIEKHEAIAALDDIVDEADGVMVARGDLGVEMPLEDVPLLQKKIIRVSRTRHKPVITATQMLESMIENPRPTRAEVSDVANAILDGTDAVMLSAETAVGRHPAEAVKTMVRVAAATEGASSARSGDGPVGEVLPVSRSVAQAACFLAERLGAKIIIAFTESGFTARMTSSFRPRCGILGVTPSERVARRMALYHGVYPVKGREVNNIDEMIERAVSHAVEMGFLKSGDLVVITAGVPLAITGATNLIKVHSV